MGIDSLSVLGKFQLERAERSSLEALWPHILNFLLLHKETWQETETVESIRSEIFNGSLQLWLLLDSERVIRMGIMTRLAYYPRGTALQIVWAQGEEAAHAVQSIDYLEQQAKELGCFRVEVQMGRPGWAKLLKPHGYKEVYRVIGRTVDPTLRMDH